MIFNQITNPGVYEVKITKADDITLESELMTCDFKWETGFVCDKPYFLITGYSISGSVLSYNDPMPNVGVFLYTGEPSSFTKESKPINS